MHKERFEQNLLKIHFEQRSFADFLKDLKLWYVAFRSLLLLLIHLSYLSN